jgi:PAS domain S-box-containing protein
MEKFAAFLFENHLRLVSDMCLKQFYEGNSFSLYLYQSLHAPEELVLKEAEKFLSQLAEKKLTEEISQWIKDLKKGKLSHQPKLTDILPVFHTRKKILTSLLPLYTRDADKTLSITRELEEAFWEQEQFVLNIIEDSQNQLLSECTILENEETLSETGHCEIDYLNGTITCSKEFYEIFRIETQTKLTFDLLKNMVLPDNGFNPFSEQPNQTFKDGRSNCHEFRIRRKDNEVLTIISEDRPILDDKGNLTGVRKYIQDITHLRQIHEILEKEKGLLYKILDIIPEHIAVYELESDKFIFANKAAILFYHGAGKDILNEKFSEVLNTMVHPNDKEKINLRIQDYEKPEKNYYSRIEFRLVYPDGKIFWFYSIAIVFRKEGDELKQILISATNITALKNTEEKLRLNEAKLREAQKIARIGTFEWNIETGASFISEELKKMYELPPDVETFSYQEFRKIIRPDYLPEHDQNMTMLFTGSFESLEEELVVVLNEKSPKHILVRIRILRNRSGQPRQILGTILDITGLKEKEKKVQEKNKELSLAYSRLEEARKDLEKINAELENRVKMRTRELKESKELYYTFFKQSTVGFWRFELINLPFIDTKLPPEDQVQLISDNIYIAEANEYLKHIFELESTENFIGKRLSDFILITNEQKTELYRKAILSDYRLDNIELSVVSIKGTRLILEISVFGVVENERLLRGWGILRDITQQKKSGKALLESESRYRFLTESVPHIVWSTDAAGKIEFANQRLYDYTGTSPEENPSILNWLSFIHPDDSPETINVWKECITTGTICQYEFRLKRADGTFRWHLGSALTVKDENGNIFRWMGTAMDIENQKNLAQILEKKNDELARINGEMDNFIYTVSHDLKSPVANLEGLTRTLQAALSDECKKQNEAGVILNLLTTTVNKFKSNLNQLIEIALAEKRSHQQVMEENNLDEVMEEVNFMIQSLVNASGAKITTDFSECPVILFHRKNLQSIFYNLISNAIKYRSPDRIPEIQIKTERVKDFVLLSVKDNGLGFEQDQVKKILSHFKRLHKEIEGSGVGLYLIKRIINNAGGKIEVESSLGKGSVFKVYLRSNC